MQTQTFHAFQAIARAEGDYRRDRPERRDGTRTRTARQVSRDRRAERALKGTR